MEVDITSTLSLLVSKPKPQVPKASLPLVWRWAKAGLGGWAGYMSTKKFRLPLQKAGALSGTMTCTGIFGTACRICRSLPGVLGMTRQASKATIRLAADLVERRRRIQGRWRQEYMLVRRQLSEGESFVLRVPCLGLGLSGELTTGPPPPIV